MEVEQLAPGLWRWSTVRAGSEVWCVYYETPDAILLIDPVVPADADRFFGALDRDVQRLGARVAIVSTSTERVADAAELAQRYGASIVRA